MRIGLTLLEGKVYQAWSDMRKRCRSKKCPSYPAYGGRGISICDRWDKFENFLADIGLPPTTKHSLDRIDNNGNYEPSNCRWATDHIQNRNTRTNKFIKVGDITLCKADWERKLGLSCGAIHNVAKRRGCTPDDVVRRYVAEGRELRK